MSYLCSKVVNNLVQFWILHRYCFTMQSKKTSDNDDSEYVPSKESQEQTWNSSDEEVFKAKKPVRKQRKLQKPTSRRKSHPGDSNRVSKLSAVPPPPAKSPHNNKKSEYSGDLKSDGIPLRQSMGFCPICQIPFDILKISPVAHTATCNVSGNSPGNNVWFAMSINI